jgi:ankyrin repeat protein
MVHIYGLGQNCCNIVDALLRGRADPNKAINDGTTPLCAAAAIGQCEAVKALVRARADVTLSCYGQTPLAVASRKGFHDIVTILKDAALNVAE